MVNRSERKMKSPAKRVKRKGIMAKLFSNYYLTTTVAIVAVILATFYAGKTTAITYGQIKRLAGLAILAKALKPDLIPIPIPMHLDKMQMPSFMKPPQKESIKPVFIPVPIHHYHTTQKVFKGLSSGGKGQVIYTTPSFGGFGTNIYGGLGSHTPYSGSSDIASFAGGSGGHSNYGSTGSGISSIGSLGSGSSYGGSGGSYGGSASGSGYLGSSSSGHDGGHSGEQESYTASSSSDSNLVESASTHHGGSYSQPTSSSGSGSAFFPAASASAQGPFYKSPMNWFNALPNGASRFVQQYMPPNFNMGQFGIPKAPASSTHPAGKMVTASSPDGRAKATSGYFSTVPNGKGVMSASASSNDGGSSWSSSSVSGGSTSSSSQSSTTN